MLCLLATPETELEFPLRLAPEPTKWSATLPDILTVEKEKLKDPVLLSDVIGLIFL